VNAAASLRRQFSWAFFTFFTHELPNRCTYSDSLHWVPIRRIDDRRTSAGGWEKCGQGGTKPFCAWFRALHTDVPHWIEFPHSVHCCQSA